MESICFAALGAALNYVRRWEQDTEMCPKVALECAENTEQLPLNREEKHNTSVTYDFEANVSPLEHHPWLPLPMLALETGHLPGNLCLRDCL